LGEDAGMGKTLGLWVFMLNYDKVTYTTQNHANTYKPTTYKNPFDLCRENTYIVAMKQQNNLPDVIGTILSKKEAAKHLGVSTRTLERLMREGKIAFLKYGTGKKDVVRLRLADVQEFLTRSLVPSAASAGAMTVPIASSPAASQTLNACKEEIYNWRDLFIDDHIEENDEVLDEETHKWVKVSAAIVGNPCAMLLGEYRRPLPPTEM